VDDVDFSDIDDFESKPAAAKKPTAKAKRADDSDDDFGGSDEDVPLMERLMKKIKH